MTEECPERFYHRGNDGYREFCCVEKGQHNDHRLQRTGVVLHDLPAGGLLIEASYPAGLDAFIGIPCRRCDGCGRIANSEDGEPWSVWQRLQPAASLMVRLGIIQPIVCPDCAGTGKRREEAEGES